MEMSENDYFKTRLDDQINWYDSKSQSCQSSFKRLRLFEIVLACSLPILVSLPDSVAPYATILAGVFGVAIAILSSVLALYKFEENWIKYRTTCESLKHQRFLYVTGSEPYHQLDAFNRLVLCVEGLISKENSSWSQSAVQSSVDRKASNS